MHRSRAPNCPFVRRTVTQGGVAKTAIDGEEDMVSLNSDVKDDELLEEHNGSCGVSKKEMGMTAKHLQLPAALISKLSLIRGCVNLSYTLIRSCFLFQGPACAAFPVCLCCRQSGAEERKRTITF